MWSAPKTRTASPRYSSIRWRFWKTESAVPRYQDSPIRICAGTTVTKASYELRAPQVRWTCSASDCDLYCVST